MSKLKTLKEWGSRLSLTRRNFLKGSLAIGASASVIGCEKSSSEPIFIGGSGAIEEDLTPDMIRYGTTGHNCGSRCLTKAHVKDGRIIRFTTDESIFDGEGKIIDSNSENCTASRACARCRSYKFRLYHPGRLKYPLKQTKQRGDLTGFVRMSWDNALNDISKKHKAITKKYGVESFHSIYACGGIASSFQGAGYTGLWQGMGGSPVAKLLGGYIPYTNDYSFHQSSFFTNRYTGYQSGSISASTVADVVKNIVLWGSNILTTDHATSHSWITSMNKMKKRDAESKVYFIGPEFVDTGVTLADEWLQIRPYTDTAVIMAMIHHMITNTFDTNGNIRNDVDKTLQLDLNYIDTMVHGFFDSPEYNIVNTDGTITVETAEAEGTERKIAAVPAGLSLSAYIMGDDKRLTNAKYGVAYNGKTNYTGTTFAAAKVSGAARPRNLSVCSYTVSGAKVTAENAATSKYKTKQNYLTPKTPEWAEKISGIPAAKIRELAELYINPANHPIHSEWAGGQTKQAEGVITYFATHALLILTKTWGQTGDSYGRQFRPSTKASKNIGLSSIPTSVPANPQTPVVSCTTWDNGIKFAFGDKLKEGGYTGNNIPDWKDTDKGVGKVYHDDAAAKSLVKWDRETNGDIKTDANGYYQYEKDGSGNPIYSGIRFIMNSGGNIFANQHMNTNDCTAMYEALPIASENPDDADTLCLVSFDNFLSPSPRWSDYVLPATTLWEQEDYIGIELGNSIYIPVVSKPPGESLSPYNFSNALLKASGGQDLATKFTGGSVPGKQIEDFAKEAFAKKSTDPDSPYHRYSWKEYLENPYIPKIDNTPANPVTITKSTLRENIDIYLAGDMTDKFIIPDQGTHDHDGEPSTPEVTLRSKHVYTIPATTNGGYGDFGIAFPTAISATAPSTTGKFALYSDILVWRYENRYSKFHGWLPKAQQGMANKDVENDPIVYPIPMYFAYEDYFNEAYGKMNGKTVNLSDYPFLLTTTHDRYRTHSSQSENPLLRELSHRTIGGKLYSGNDWKEYALLGSGADEDENIPRLNKALGTPNATYSEIWMNDEDGKSKGINDGDLCLVENPIGKVHVVARLSQRCVKGFLGLHQGCWYDPDPITGIDDGGCANTLMATKPSRIDHGNAQQSAMVKITKI